MNKSRGASQGASQGLVRLSAAAVWGTTVVSLERLATGESFELGTPRRVPKPEGSPVVDVPIRAVGAGWELDAKGATGGLVHLRGRQENPAHLAASGAPIPIVSGDYGLLQYGNFSIFFQFTENPAPLPRKLRFDWVFALAYVFSFLSLVGGLALLFALSTPGLIPKPMELVSDEEIAKILQIEAEPESDKGKKDKKDKGGGKKAKGSEGKLGKKGPAENTKLKGELRQGLGAMSEVLDSEVGEEIRQTLGSISSVAEALGGLDSDSISLGRGTGLGFRGTGSGGGGDSAGVPFGSGTMKTGWGKGRGGGYGKGRGGALGGKGGGEGGEKKVVGKQGGAKNGGLTPAQIQRVVNSRFGAFRACYESAAARNPSLKGGLTISWSISAGGSVNGARVSRSSLGSARVEGCILRQVRRLRFPTAGKATNAAYPFMFRPGKK
ncbi:MAG: AgmX/PglI C-terminal domain-containing protein [Polyangiaceae bacterium]|nr:AgmX/PglI C-terminal domain-containing protein [Polyangiaceae bacterium]